MASGARSIWTRRQTDVVCLAFLLLTVGAFIAVLGLSDTCTVPTLEANQTYSANTSENASSAMPSAENTSSVVCSVSMSPLGVDPSAASIIFSYAVPAAVSATQILLTFAATKSLAAWRRRLAILVTPIAPVVTFMWVRGSTFTSPAVTHLCTLAVCAYVAIWWYSSRKISRISAAICAETTRLVSLPHQLLLGTMSAALQAPLVVVSLAALGDVVTTGDLSRLSSPRLVGLILLPLVLASFVHQLASHVTAVLVYGRFFFSNGPDEEAQPLSLPRAIAMICRYHLGSVFFAALVQQVASSLRRLAASTERELASTQRENFAAKLFVKLVHCCLLYPVKKFVKFISCYATVVVASQGNTFCHAGYRTFFFFLQNPGQVAIQEKVSTEIEYITSLVLAVACTLVYAAAEAQTSPLASTYATGGVFLVSYTIFRAYTSQMNMAVLATFCCCFQDKAEFGGKHMSERLATAFGMKRRGDGRSLEDDLDDQAENDNEQGGGGWRFGGGALGSQAKKAKKMKVKSGWQMSNPVAPSAEPTALSTGSSSPLKVSFWFVKADKVREAARDKDTAVLSALTQNHQSLKQMAPQLLVRQDIDKRKAFSGAYKDTYVSVSHRWENSIEPDPTRTQQNTIIDYLIKNASIQYIWLDFWCMPQGNKTQSEKEEFGQMLPNINMLYLGTQVLILLDLSYMSRFWTQFEAWLSFQQGTTLGLKPATTSKTKRYHIVPIHGAAASPKLEKFMHDGLITMWSNQTPREAFEHLSLPDVFVTNAKDKEVQLPKILQLSEEVKQFLSGKAAPQEDSKEDEEDVLQNL